MTLSAPPCPLASTALSPPAWKILQVGILQVGAWPGHRGRRPSVSILCFFPRKELAGSVSSGLTVYKGDPALTHAASSAPQSIASGKSAPMAPPRIRGGHFLRQRPDSRYFSLFFQSMLRTARGRRRNPGGPVGAALGAGSRGSLESSPASFLPCSQG